MKFSLPLFFVSAITSPTLSASVSTGLRGGNGERALEGTVTGTYLLGDIQYEQGSDATGPEEVDAIELSNGEILELTNTGLPPGQFKKQFKSGADSIELPAGTTIKNGKADLKGKPPHAKGNAKGRGNPFDRNLKGQRTPAQERNLAELRRNLAVVGDRTILAVRVVGADSSYSQTEAYLRDAWLGTNDDGRNLKSQYRACSNDKLRFDATASRTMTNDPNDGVSTDITNGVVTVKISNTVNGVADSTIRNAVTSQLQTNFGTSSGLADHVIVCVPPGTTGSWIGYAYINSWLSVYNNNWCNYLSIQMHEIGHNIGLAHSNEAGTYRDQTGMMGYSYSQDDGPAMCFNSAKMWQLGWGPQVTVETGNDWEGSIAGKGVEGVEPGVIKINQGTPDYFVSFNRDYGYNSGTVEAQNQVTVNRQGNEGNSYAESELMCKLSAGASCTVGADTITVVSIDLGANSNAGSATIRINDGGPVTPPPTPPPTTAPPTPNPTPNPTPQPTPIPTTAAPTTAQPTSPPTPNPTPQPTPIPTTAAPTTAQPTMPPTPNPTPQPTPIPTTAAPTTAQPTSPPTPSPSKSPSVSPTTGPPSASPSKNPTNSPTKQPTPNPTPNPTTAAPTTAPPTPNPTPNPTSQPTQSINCGSFNQGGRCKEQSQCKWRKGSCIVCPANEFPCIGV